jgi:hypothetical protein
MPADSGTCACGNIEVDVDFGRLVITDPNEAKSFRLTRD